MKSLFVTPRFWILLFSLIVVVVATISPGFELEVENAAAMAVVVVSYMLGLAVDPGPGGWRGYLRSRKFWAAAIGLAMIFLDAFHILLPAGMTPELLITLSVLFGGAIGSFALEKPPIGINISPPEMDPRETANLINRALGR